MRSAAIFSVKEYIFYFIDVEYGNIDKSSDSSELLLNLCL